MTVKQRMLTIRLMEKAKRDPDHAKQLGIEVVYGERKKKGGHHVSAVADGFHAGRFGG